MQQTSGLYGAHVFRRKRFREPVWAARPDVPAYLKEVYTWAYLNPLSVRLLDREAVVAVILWGWHRRLQDAALAEINPGDRVLLSSHVYGQFPVRLAQKIGKSGKLDVIDVAPVQAAHAEAKLAPYPQASVHLADAAKPFAASMGCSYDVAISYFLLHEVPETHKHLIVDQLLMSLAPGGKALFMDYHKPVWFHPLKPLMSLVFDWLEPFAKALWQKTIADYTSIENGIDWRTETYFGGLYQKTVASLPPSPHHHHG